MEVLHPKNLAAQTFTGAPSVVLKKVSPRTYLLKHKEVKYVDTLSFLTALTSATGFAVGGYGLLSDHAFDRKSGKKQELIVVENKNISEKFKNFGPSSQQIIKAGKSGATDGAKTIVPSTKTAKIGLIFAKIGIAFSGVAGIFNGISMGLPLMAAGEALNLGASPIIETPLGTGLFGIALAAVFSGRALEHDPLLRLDTVKLSQEKGFGKKASYVSKNIGNCLKSVGSTAVAFAKYTGQLFSTNKNVRTEAVGFFKNNVFSIKPKSIVIQEFIDKNGKVIIKTAFKNNPYLMHAASLVLAVGGGTLALSSIIKSKNGQKVGLKTYEVGGGIDNLSLSRSGFEKAAIAGTPTQKLAGGLLGLSGLTILAGQPGVDEKWGRGTQWIGTALLFAVFAVERKANAFKRISEKTKLSSLIRQHNIDLTKLFTKAELSEVLPCGKKRIDNILKYVADNKKNPIEDPTVKALIDFAEKKLGGHSYKVKSFDYSKTGFRVKKGNMKDFNFLEAFERYSRKNAATKNMNLNMEKIKAAVSKEDGEGIFKDITSSLATETEEKFRSKWRFTTNRKIKRKRNAPKA